MRDVVVEYCRECSGVIYVNPEGKWKHRDGYTGDRFLIPSHKAVPAKNVTTVWSEE